MPNYTITYKLIVTLNMHIQTSMGPGGPRRGAAQVGGAEEPGRVACPLAYIKLHDVYNAWFKLVSVKLMLD